MNPPVGLRLDRHPSWVSGPTIEWSFWYEKYVSSASARSDDFDRFWVQLTVAKSLQLRKPN